MTNNVLALANDRLLMPGGIDQTDLEKVMGTLMGPAIDSADLYFQYAMRESWVLEDGIVKEGSYSVDQGVGARAISGEKTGFAYSDELMLPALLDASKAAKAIARSGKAGTVQAWQQSSHPALYSTDNPMNSMSETDKVSLLRHLDAYARSLDNRVKQVIIALVSSYETVLIAGSDGTYAADVRPLVRMSVSVIVEEGNDREQGSAGGGGRLSYNYFMEEKRAEHYVDEAVRQALIKLKAIPAPAGAMPVVLGAGWPGVLLHEAVGHGLEGDFNRKGTSVFSGRVGEKVASEACTVVDDGTLAEHRGSLSIDDEGVTTQSTVLIENGILKGYLQDKLNAKLMGVASTGNGRRESYSHLPMPRMTNTFMLPGQYEPEEIIATIDKGIYAVNFGGGQVDITSGKFVFSASEAYLVEKGKIKEPVKGATLIGSGAEVMTKVSMVGNDLQIDPGVGVCGKAGQMVPVGVGQPTLKIDSLTVGGTATA